MTKLIVMKCSFPIHKSKLVKSKRRGYFAKKVDLPLCG